MVLRRVHVTKVGLVQVVTSTMTSVPSHLAKIVACALTQLLRPTRAIPRGSGSASLIASVLVDGTDLNAAWTQMNAPIIHARMMASVPNRTAVRLQSAGSTALAVMGGPAQHAQMMWTSA